MTYCACMPQACSRVASFKSIALFRLGIRSRAKVPLGGSMQSWNSENTQPLLQDAKASSNSWGLIGGYSAFGGLGL